LFLSFSFFAPKGPASTNLHCLFRAVSIRRAPTCVPSKRPSPAIASQPRVSTVCGQFPAATHAAQA
jgi:hypothetical protein